MQDCPTGGESEATVLIIDCVEFHSARRKRKGPGGLAAGLTCKKEKEGDEERVGLIKKGGYQGSCQQIREDSRERGSGCMD